MVKICWINTTFVDVATTLYHTLLDSNINTKITLLKNIPKNVIHDDDLYILYGIHRYIGNLPKHYIVIQLEQTDRSGWFTDGYLERLRKAIYIWDYSQVNVNTLIEKYNFKHVKWVPLGIDNRIKEFVHVNDPRSKKLCEKHEPLQVLFMGAMNDRRQNLLNKIKAHTQARIKTAKCVWGDKRDEIVRSSQIVVNLHYYDNAILETTRLSYLLEQGAHIISERSSDKTLDEMFDKNIVFVDDYDSLLSTIRYYLSNPDKLPILKDIYKFKLDKECLDIICEYSISEEKEKENKKLFDKEKTLKKENDNEKKKDSELKQEEELEFGQVNTITHPDNSVQLLLGKDLPPYDLPKVSIITPTMSSRSELFKIAIRNFKSFKYLRTKLEWIIVDDSPTQELEKTFNLNKKRNVKYVWCGENGKKTIGFKRNLGVSSTSSDSKIIIHMDDDDYYFPDSVTAKVKLLAKYNKAQCIGCVKYGVYHILENYSFSMTSKLMSEASMAYTKNFWIDRPFPEDDDPLGEGYLFLNGRENQALTMPHMFNFIAMTHGNNVTNELRSIPKNKRTTNENNLFRLFDNSTQMFLTEIKNNLQEKK